MSTAPTAALDLRCIPAGVSQPIRSPASSPFQLRTTRLDTERLESLTRNWGERTTLASRLDEKLRAFGGQFSLVRDSERELSRILVRGQLWGATDVVTEGGEPSQCHANAARLWSRNQLTFHLATGYALSADGLWRQHTWCVQPTPAGAKVLETTTPRIGYFGYVLALPEAVDFVGLNVGAEMYQALQLEDGVQELYAQLNATPTRRKSP